MGNPSTLAAYDPPRITSVRYDDNLLTVTWLIVTPRATTTAFRVSVLDRGTLIAEAGAGPGLTLTLPIVLTPGRAYTVRVALYVDNILRATSAPATLTVDTVAVGRAETDPATGALTLTWPVAGNDGFLAALTVNGVLSVQDVPAAGATAVFNPPPPPGATVAARLARVRVQGTALDQVRITGPYGPVFAVPTYRPDLAEVGFHAGTLTASWVGVATTDAHRVTVLRDGEVFFGVTVPAPTTTVAVTPGITDTDAYTVVVQTLDETGSGPPSAPLPVLTAAPGVTATADGAALSLDVTPPPGITPTGYDVHLLRDGMAVHTATLTAAPTLSLILPETLPAGGAYTVAVRARVGRAAGPAAFAPVRLTTAPTGVTVEYDGADLRVSWAPVTTPLVAGYRVSTITGGASNPVGDTTGTSGSWPLTLTDTSTTVVVAALVGATAGTPSAPVPVFTEALFLGAAYLVPQTSPALAATDIVLGLPELFTVPRTDSESLPLGFVLTPDDAGYRYTLLIPWNSPVWTFADRADVVAGWTALLHQLEGHGLTSYGAAAITEAVARSMPQTFPETLYFAYGLRFDRGCFDLRPGLVVRVEYESYQVVPGAQTSQLSGYVTGGVADYEVASYDRAGRWTHGLDTFLAALTQSGVVVPLPSPQLPAPQLYGSAGVLDPFTPSMQLPYARFVYPPTTLPTATAGSTLPQENVVLLTATTLAALETATDNVRHGYPPGTGVAAAHLRGRAVVRALVRIFVDGTPRLVPVGSTLGDVLAGEARRPFTGPVTLRGAALRRPRAAAVTPAGPAGDWRVAVDWAGSHPAILDLPLLHGDRLALGRAG